VRHVGRAVDQVEAEVPGEQPGRSGHIDIDIDIDPDEDGLCDEDRYTEIHPYSAPSVAG